MTNAEMVVHINDDECGTFCGLQLPHTMEGEIDDGRIQTVDGVSDEVTCIQCWRVAVLIGCEQMKEFALTTMNIEWLKMMHDDLGVMEQKYGALQIEHLGEKE